ncbi:hypothetical protein ABIB51_002728 [Arthrobacter sp. UYCu712]
MIDVGERAGIRRLYVCVRNRQPVGYTGGHSVFHATTAEIRATLTIPDLSSDRSFDPREMIQWDLWSPTERIIPTGARCHAFATCAHHGLRLSALAHGPCADFPHHGDLVAGMSLLLESLMAVPRKLLWDNEAGNGPESKGLVERASQYLQDPASLPLVTYYLTWDENSAPGIGSIRHIFFVRFSP